MFLAHCQTVEDSDPLDCRLPEMTLHHEYTLAEFVRYEFRVRRPWSCRDFDERLVLRLSQTSTRITCALQELRVE
jgi:hypothetical protein